MKMLIRVTFGCVLLLADGAVCWGQNAANPVEATLCDLYQHPEQYSGKMVKIRGTVSGTVSRNNLSIDAFSDCSTYMRVSVVYPSQIKPAPGFDLARDKSFKEFEDAFYHGMHVEVTIEGRFDAAFYWRDQKRIPVGQVHLKGYGKKHDYDGQIVLHEVSDVVTKYIPRK